MSSDNGYLTGAEFERAMKALERQINSGFDRTDHRLEKLEDAMLPIAERVAVLGGHQANQNPPGQLDGGSGGRCYRRHRSCPARLPRRRRQLTPPSHTHRAGLRLSPPSFYKGVSMPRFRSQLIVSPVDQGTLWILGAPLVYESQVPGVKTVVVPAGFVFDGNSVPRVASCISPPTDYLAAGACHDFLYRFGAVSRETADSVYFEALCVLGMSRFRAYVRFLALRLFGARAYMKPQTI